MTDGRRAARPAGGALDYAAVLAGNIVLALGPWMVRLSDVGPVAAAFWRLLLALPALVLLALWAGRGRRQPSVPRTVWAMLALGGLLFAGDLASWHAGIHHTRLANASLFGNITSFTFPIYTYLVTRRWPGRSHMAALLLGGVGVVLLIGRSYELSPENLRGDILCLAAGLLYTGYLVVVGRSGAQVNPMAALASATAAGVLPLLGAAALFGEKIWPDHWGPLLGLALGSQVLGQGLIVYAVGRLPAVVIGLSLLLQPVVGAAIGWVRYDEALGVFDLIGALAVAAALVLVRRPEPPVSARPLPT